MDNGSAREQRANARGAAAVAAATATPQEGTIATTIVGQNDTFMPMEIPAITGVLEDPASGNFTEEQRWAQILIVFYLEVRFK